MVKTTQRAAPGGAGTPAIDPDNQEQRDPGLPAVIQGDDDFAAYAGRGAESVGAADLLVPRLSILQGLSDQINKQHSAYIPGAQVGEIADLGTGEVFEAPLWVLPCHYQKVWIEWAPRNSGKGLIAVHPTSEIMAQTTQNDRKQNVLQNGNYVAETAQFYVLNLSAGGRPSFISFGGTQLKKSRRWLTIATNERLKRVDGSEFQPPLFYRSYLLGTAYESNSQGSWYGWTVQPGKALPEVTELDWRSLKARAVEFQASVARGEARGDESAGADQAPGGDGEQPL